MYGCVAFFADVGGFLCGVLATRVFTSAGRIATQTQITLICELRADPKKCSGTAALCYSAGQYRYSQHRLSGGGISAVNCLYYRPTTTSHQRAPPAPDNVRGRAWTAIPVSATTG
jgi:hypothetical protein